VTTLLFDPPPVHGLPVSWHGDLVVDFENVDPDSADPNNPDPLNYEAGVVGYLDLKTEPVQRFTAAITGNHAVVRVESEITDDLKNGVLWVFLLQYPGSPTTELPVTNGQVERHDGRTS
jgi:hypothetical protein